MTHYRIRLTLESDAAFGRGSGIPGLIDQDIVLDAYGCPYLHGRTLKGLLSEVCSEILYSLKTDEQVVQPWIEAADQLFGIPGSKLESQGKMRIGHAQLPADLRTAIRHAVDRGADSWTPDEVTESLTTIRHQTALETGGAPDSHTLRAVRVILRRTVFHADLHMPAGETPGQKGLIAACVKGLRRAGLARNRGRGRLIAAIETEEGENLSDRWFREHFMQEVCQ
jgi:hypothetical protein